MRTLLATTAVVVVALAGAGCGGDDDGDKKTKFRATANANPFGGPRPLTVNFTASAKGTEGEVSYRWSFDDGTTSTEQNPTHRFTKAGYYLAKVVVRDEANHQEQKNLYLGIWPPKVWFSAQRGLGQKQIVDNVREQQRRTRARKRELLEESRRAARQQQD